MKNCDTYSFKSNSHNTEEEKNRANKSGSDILSVIIPTKNEGKYLPKLINCLQDQTFRDFKIIIADNFSTDGTVKFCQEHGLKMVVGGYPGKGRNTGASHSKAKYYLFLDADIQIDPNFIERAIRKLKKEGIDALSFGFVPDTSKLNLKLIHLLCKCYFHICQIIGFPHGLGGALLVKSKVHKSINGFDETVTVAEDHDYVRRLSKSFKYVFTDRPRVRLSVRRFLAEGILQHCRRWLIIEFNRIFSGEIRYGKIPYFETHRRLCNAKRNKSNVGRIQVLKE